MTSGAAALLLMIRSLVESWMRTPIFLTRTIQAGSHSISGAKPIADWQK